MHVLERYLVASLTAAVLAAAPQPADARALGVCHDPVAWDAPVNVFVLQYGFVRSEDSDSTFDLVLEDTARRLALLVQLDTLLSYREGGLASHLLFEEEHGSCNFGQVAEDLPDLSPGRVVALLTGRIYREADAILLQSYLRFFRIDENADSAVELVSFELDQGLPRFRGKLPTQSLSFPPRRLHADDLERIEAAFREVTLLYERPEESSPNEPLEITRLKAPQYLVTDGEQGWVRLEDMFHGTLGWIRPDVGYVTDLRTLMPELYYLEAVIDFLRWRQNMEGTMAGRLIAPSGAAERIVALLATYDAAEEATEVRLPTGLAMALHAVLALEGASAEPNVDVLAVLDRAVELLPTDSDLRNLRAIARLADCCAGGDGVVVPSVLSGITAALSFNPGNTEALSNLDAFYDALAVIESRRPADPSAQIELAEWSAWRTAETSADLQDKVEFVWRFPDGSFAEAAKGQLAEEELWGVPTTGRVDPELGLGEVLTNLNMRAAPSTEATAIDLLKGGDTVGIVGRATDHPTWLAVRRSDAGLGYLHSDYVGLRPASAEVLVNARLRAAPATDAASTGILLGGSSVPVVSWSVGDGTWLAVRRRDGEIGYVRSDLVALSGGIEIPPVAQRARYSRLTSAIPLDATEIAERLEQVRRIRAAIGAED